jgi:hypothetical protein
MEKITVQASSLSAAMSSLGTSTNTNYWSRPYHPQDNVDSSTPSNSTWEFWRATAYWKAPFTKNAGEMFVSLDQEGSIEYTNINPRPDWREERTIRRPKIGSVETSDETVFGIYNDVCMKLKDKMTPSFDITVDVANLRKGRYNDYQLHDKVYVKLPDYQELVTARVSKTVKEAHDVAKNTITLDNYSINAVKNDADFMSEYGIVCFMPDDTQGFITFDNDDLEKSQSVSNLNFPLDTNTTFYVYLWTSNGTGFYPDVLITKNTIENGVISSEDPSGYNVLEPFIITADVKGYTGYYDVEFSASVSTADAGVVAIGLFQDGVLIPDTVRAVTLAAADDYETISFDKKLRVCPRGTTNISVQSVPSVPTPTTPTTPISTTQAIITNATFSISRLNR